MNKKSFLNLATLIFFSFIFSCKIYGKDESLQHKSDIESTIKSKQDFPLKTDPLIVVVLMVKNEEDVIVETLNPLFKAGIDSFFIYDTGSTDKTLENVQNFFDKNQITNACITQEPFIDFATSRNKALDHAREKFPNSTFMVMPDAEWYLENGQELVNFCKNKINDYHNLYLLRVNNHTDDFYHGRLLRTKANLRFEGVVHEVIASPFMDKVDNKVCFNYRPRSSGVEKSAQRWIRDEQLLLKKVQENPKDSRHTFYLAQTYECLNNLHKAYHYYVVRSELLGWHEENYETFYRLGGVTNSLSKFDPKFTQKMVQDYYLKASSMSPHRAEPLIKIAEMYWPSNFSLCFKFARLALELPYPKDDVLFVNKEIYEFTRYEIISKVAWYMDEFELGEHASRKAIDAHPEMIHLYNNLRLYMDRKNKNLLEELSKAEIKNLTMLAKNV